MWAKFRGLPLTRRPSFSFRTGATGLVQAASPEGYPCEYGVACMIATRSTPSPSERSSSQVGSRHSPLPARSPNLNAYAERWVRSAKEECLSKMILFGEGPLSRTLAEFSAHYHGERNHQGKGNKLLFPDASNKSEQRGHAVECRQRLGGL